MHTEQENFQLKLRHVIKTIIVHGYEINSSLVVTMWILEANQLYYKTPQTGRSLRAVPTLLKAIFLQCQAAKMPY